MTWSIVARDPQTNRVGVAVASRFYAVGAICPWTASGVGAVSTQALINPYFGPQVLRLLEDGVAVHTAIDALTADDPQLAQRQVHAVATDGTVAAFTGKDCVDWSGHRTADHVSVAGNMLAGPQVVDATIEAFAHSADRPLAERLLRAMTAGERAGGDKRGKQSAAIVVHGTEIYADVNLRVDDHPDPIAELWRIYQVGHERYFAFHETMPTRTAPHGVTDRDILEHRIDTWLAEHGDVDFTEFWSHDPWGDR